MLLFLHFVPVEKGFLETAAKNLDVAHRCNFDKGTERLFGLAESKTAGAMTSEKFPAVIFLNADADEHVQTLKSLKAHDVLNRVPVVCLGYAKSHEEIVSLYEMGANSFIVKPNDFDTMLEVSATALSYWLDTTLLPQSHLEGL